MKYIDPSFIDHMLEEHCNWCSELKESFVSPSGWSPAEINFLDFLRNNMLRVVQMKQEEMISFVEEINRNFPYVYCNLKDDIKKLHLQKGRPSSQNLLSLFLNINQLLKNYGCVNIIKKDSFHKMQNNALQIFNNYFNQEKVFREIELLFDYNKFHIERSAEFIQKSGIESCPYCERAYITSFNGDTGYSADLDHFFPKSKYPFFGITLHNLVPCCAFCNERCKKTEDFLENRHLSPYEREDAEKIAFSIKEDILNIDFNDLNSFTIEVIPIGSNKAQSNIETFKLRDLYQSHKQTVARLAKIKEFNTEEFRTEIMKLCNDNDSSVILNLFDKLSSLSGTSDILEKFVKDISSYLDDNINVNFQ